MVDTNSQLFWLLGNVLLASILVGLTGLMVVRLSRRQSPDVRHKTLQVFCVVLLSLPLLHWMGSRGGVAWIEFDESVPVFSSSAGGTLLLHANHNAGSFSAKPIFSWSTVAGVGAGIWIMGLFISLGRTLIEFWRFSTWLKMTRPCADPGLRCQLGRAAEMVGISTPQLRVTSAEISPMVIGWLRPTVIVPKSLWSQQKGESTTDWGTLAVLVHECEHIRRRDHWWSLVSLITQAVYWWNWFVRRMLAQMEGLRERVCDDQAVRQTAAPREYVDSLVVLADRATKGQSENFALCLMPKRTDLLARVHRLAGGNSDEKPTNYATPFVWVAAALAISVPTCVPIGRPSQVQETIVDGINDETKFVSPASNDPSALLDEGIVYLSLVDAESSMPQALSNALGTHRPGRGGVILDLREAIQNGRFDGESDFRGTLRAPGAAIPNEDGIAPTHQRDDVSVVVILHDDESLTRELRSVIASADLGVRVLTADRIGSAIVGRPIERSFDDQFRSSRFSNSFLAPVTHSPGDTHLPMDPYLNWAMRILRHA